MNTLKEVAKFFVMVGMWVVGLILGIIGFSVFMLLGLIMLAFVAEIFKVLTLDILVPLAVLAIFVMLTVKLYEALFKNKQES